MSDDDWERHVGPCMYCGGPIPIAGPAPVTVSLVASNDKYQTFYAHLDCVEKHVKQGNGVELNLR